MGHTPKATLAAVAQKLDHVAAMSEQRQAGERSAVINALEQEQNIRRAYASKLVEKLSAADLANQEDAALACDVYDLAEALAREDMRRAHEELISTLAAIGQMPAWSTVKTCERLGVETKMNHGIEVP